MVTPVKRVHVNIPPELVDEIDQVADALSVSRSDMVRLILHRWSTDGRSRPLP